MAGGISNLRYPYNTTPYATQGSPQNRAVPGGGGGGVVSGAPIQNPPTRDERLASEERTRQQQAEYEARQRQTFLDNQARGDATMQRDRDMMNAYSLQSQANMGLTGVQPGTNYTVVGPSSGSGSRSTSGTGSGGGGTPGAIPPELLAALQPQPPPPFPQPPPLPARTPLAQPTLEDPAQAFAAAKDVSGRQGVAAVRALRDLMTKRGMSDSGMETEEEANILSNVANYNVDADRAARSRNVDRQNEFALANAGLGSGERGQDASYGSNTFGTQAGYNANIYGTQAGQRNNALDALMRWYSLQY